MSELRAEVGSLHLGYSALPDEALRVTCGWDSAFHNAYSVYVHEEPHLFDPVYSLEPGRFVDVEELLPDRMLVDSRMYNEWLRPQRLRHLLAGTLHRSHSQIFGLGLMRRPTSSSFGRAALDLLHELAPHMERAVQVQDALGVARLEEARAEQTLDALRVGVIVADTRGRMLYANRKAQAILAQHDGLALARDGLHAANARATAALRRLVGAATLSGVGDTPGPGGVTALSRPSGRRPFAVLVSALRPGQSTALCLAGGVALVLVRDPEELPEAPETVLTRLFRLTNAEARVALRIAQGERPGEIADSLVLSVATVRTHLAVSMAKMGARSQKDLVQIVVSVGGRIEEVVEAGTAWACPPPS